MIQTVEILSGIKNRINILAKNRSDDYKLAVSDATDLIYRTMISLSKYLVGDKVYIIFYDDILEATVQNRYICEGFIMIEVRDPLDRVLSYTLDEINQDFFLTEDDARQFLSQKGDNK